MKKAKRHIKRQHAWKCLSLPNDSKAIYTKNKTENEQTKQGNYFYLYLFICIVINDF